MFIFELSIKFPKEWCPTSSVFDNLKSFKDLALSKWWSLFKIQEYFEQRNVLLEFSIKFPKECVKWTVFDNFLKSIILDRW